jgi:putative MATE family efflux protein
VNRHVRTTILEGRASRAVVSLAVPVILGNILQTGYQLTDAFWIGRLGASAVAAVAISFPVMFLTIALGSGLAMAGAVLSAQYAGAGRQDMVDHVAGQTMVMVLFTSALFGAVGYALAPKLIALTGVAPDVAGQALGFMRVSFVGMVFVFSYAMFQALMRGIGQTRLPLLIVSATVVLNFALDPPLIFGWGPLPAFGVMGAAMATLVTQGLATLAGVAIFLRGKHGIHLRLRDLVPDLAYIRKAFFLGFPGSVELSTRALGLMVMSFLVASFGTLPTAVYGVGSTIIQVVTIPAMGLSMALSTLVGQNLGAGQMERAAAIARLGIGYGLLALSALGFAAYFAAPSLVSFFVPSDAEVIREGASFVRIMCLTWGCIGVQLCVVAAFRSSGNMLSAMVIALVSQWMIQFPLAYVLSKHTTLGPDGLWWSFPIGNALTALVSISWFARGDWATGRLTEDSQASTRITDEAMIEEGYR